MYDHNKHLAQRQEEQDKIAAFGRKLFKIHNSDKMTEGDKIAEKFKLDAAMKEALISQNQVNQFVMNNQAMLEKESLLEKLSDPKNMQLEILQTLQDIAAKLK